MTDPLLTTLTLTTTPSPPRYVYMLADTATGEILDEIPLTGVAWSRVLNGAGELTGRVPMYGLSPARRRQVFDVLREVRTSVYVQRGSVLLWGGPIWRARPDSGSQDIEISANEFLSYFGLRVIPTTLTFNDTDQFTIAESIVDTVQAVAYGNIGVLVTPMLSGVTRDRTYYGYENKSALEALQQLSAVINGFDLAIDLAYDAFGAPARQLVLSYPQRGRTAAETGLVFELPGNVTSYSYDRDGSGMASLVRALGAGDGEAALRSTASTSTLLSAGYPLTEAVVLYPDISQQSTLDLHAQADAAAYAAPVATPGVSVTAGDPQLGEYDVGDGARLRVTDPNYPQQDGGGAGLDQEVRIVTYRVTVPDSGLETVEVSFNPVLTIA